MLGGGVFFHGFWWPNAQTEHQKLQPRLQGFKKVPRGVECWYLGVCGCVGVGVWVCGCMGVWRGIRACGTRTELLHDNERLEVGMGFKVWVQSPSSWGTPPSPPPPAGEWLAGVRGVPTARQVQRDGRVSCPPGPHRGGRGPPVRTPLPAGAAARSGDRRGPPGGRSAA